MPPVNDVIIEKKRSIRYLYPKPRHRIAQTKLFSKLMKKWNILMCVPCDTKLCDFQRWSPRGHNLMFYVLAWKPASPRKCPIFGSRTALFFDLLKICQGHEHCWSTPENLRIFERRSFFYGDRPNFAENLRLFEPRPFFYESSSALCPWSFGIERVCPRKVCPWPRIFLCALDSTSGGFIAKIEA